jgi:hypothetical protein
VGIRDLLPDCWRLPRALPDQSPTSGPLTPPEERDECFWLDTFCIPQDPEHADLKNRAIGSMNLIYAAAAQTVVFDSGLQGYDAGQRPSSMIHGSRPTYYAPMEKNLLDVTARICASNWMGRAWWVHTSLHADKSAFLGCQGQVNETVQDATRGHSISETRVPPERIISISGTPAPAE